MRKLLLLLFTVCALLCKAQEYTVSIGRVNYGKIAILDQELKPNSENSLFLMYIPKVGDIEYPTLTITSPDLDSILIGENTIGVINNIIMYLHTDKGLFYYSASRDEQTINTDTDEDGKTKTSITMLLPKVTLYKGSYHHAKENLAWGKKIKKALSNSQIYDIEIKAIVSYLPNNEKFAYKTKDAETKIQFTKRIDTASIFKLLFAEGDKTLSKK